MIKSKRRIAYAKKRGNPEILSVLALTPQGPVVIGTVTKTKEVPTEDPKVFKTVKSKEWTGKTPTGSSVVSHESRDVVSRSLEKIHFGGIK